MVSVVRRAVFELVPRDEREQSSRARILRELDSLSRPFDRLSDPTHLTASAVVVGPEGVLLHRHKRLRKWLQPGGHIDPGEAPWQAALREVAEETGLVGTPVGEPGALLHVDV